MKQTHTVRIFQEADGFHWSPDSLPYLDARGYGYPAKADCIRGAYLHGYTHAVVDGRRRKIDGLVPVQSWMRAFHANAQEVLL